MTIRQRFEAIKKWMPTYAAFIENAYRSSRASAGFTLLLAALVASIVLSLGTSIYTIAVKQVQLSTLGRDSQFAFYAADTGAECALYWDVRFDAFAPDATGITPTCDGKSVTISSTGSVEPYTDTFEVDLFTDQSTGYCAEVSITKNSTSPHTVIHADGYSVTCASKAASTRALQRSVELQY